MFSQLIDGHRRQGTSCPPVDALAALACATELLSIACFDALLDKAVSAPPAPPSRAPVAFGSPGHSQPHAIQNFLLQAEDSVGLADKLRLCAEGEWTEGIAAAAAEARRVSSRDILFEGVLTKKVGGNKRS